jgi:hypothetical protein
LNPWWDELVKSTSALGPYVFENGTPLAFVSGHRDHLEREFTGEGINARLCPGGQQHWGISPIHTQYKEYWPYRPNELNERPLWVLDKIRF